MALPSAGRVTIGGVHFLASADGRVPLHETEYARDGHFSYRHAELLRWAEERSGGLLAAERGAVIAARPDAPAALIEAVRARAGVPAVVVVDAESDADLDLAAQGVRAALAEGIELVVRGAPAFAAALAGTRAASRAPPPDVGAGLLVVCGSYVPTTTRQLAALESRYPDTVVEANLAALRLDREAEIAHLSDEATRLLSDGRLAVVATPRAEPPPGTPLAEGVYFACALAAVARRVSRAAGVVLGKGGITSAIVARHGLNGRIADVVGPIAPGVAYRRVRHSDGARSYLVFPGNVGSDEALADVVDSYWEPDPCDPRCPRLPLPPAPAAPPWSRSRATTSRPQVACCRPRSGVERP